MSAPLTDEEIASIETMARGVTRDTVLLLIRDIRQARADLADAAAQWRAVVAQRDEMRDARDRLIAENDRLRALVDERPSDLVGGIRRDMLGKE